ncbi:DUF1643 domain-containing protein [Bacillus sp. 37MA]|uniref:DUF1643 domain-containing protein n=1 Tax=Bacillus sp. 37MA TaxID=1132442 RepID=UPI00036EE895|nr:DUF1643 domain-containing protein [Bacillus sp. 37MA]
MTWKIMKSKAVFDRTDPKYPYRYSLVKVWNSSLPRAVVIMLNPSIADELKMDHSVNRCVNYLIDHDYGSIEVINLFAFIETNSKKLKASKQYVGPDNDFYIKGAINDEKTSLIIIAWGRDTIYKNRKRDVLAFLEGKCLKFFEDSTERTIPVHISRLESEFKLKDYHSTLLKPKKKK